ncbi:hypothetical protein [Gallaecimonas xiamenensis]|uniref:Uncharacterized protein n=1 Tax=Gallaecimonas xiamenensis 3-C-1 TaxID=745411 RepID=K2K4V6_9GAMM|nr:hypothetical protein [Gallaecimonas xiamenensis]EKE77994.1 hypothetical protein B3C1_01000 [Gallaecimonas xiamenensis 3-C-1]
MKRDRPDPLFRKVNTKARGVHHRFGGHYRHLRNSKGAGSTKMAKDVERGLDYTPLFRFLLAKVGQLWDPVFAEAVARLDKKEPIFWLVASDLAHGEPYVRIGENSYFSGLYVDDNGILQRVAPELDETSLAPSCHCCTHTFNGKTFTQEYPF